MLKLSYLAGISLMLCMAMANVVHAMPGWGTCTNCHGVPREAFNVVGSDGTADPSGGIGNLKFFDVVPGDNVGLSAEVTNGANLYAVALEQIGSLPLNQGAGSSWTWAAPYYLTGIQAANGTHTFDLAVGGGEAEGYYPFRFTVAGDGNGRWNEQESFYVHVVPEPATMGLLLAGAATMLWRKRRAKA